MQPRAVLKHLPAALAAIAVVVVGGVACDRPWSGSHRPAETRAALRDPSRAFWMEHSPVVFTVRIDTDKGSFLIEAYRDWAPVGCDRFYNLVRAGFYDDSRFFRVRKGAFVQFGIPGDPAIAEIWRHSTIPDDPQKQRNTKGTVTYAMAGPNTRTTQLFINLTDNASLDAEGFEPIGRVVQGMEIVDHFYGAYGEEPGGGMRGGHQGPICSGGNAYLDRRFPQLVKLLRATVVGR